MAITVGSNSWVTEAQADTYFDSRYGGVAWDTAAKEDLLVTAFYDLLDCGLFSLTATTTPTDAIKRAQCEQAFFRLLDSDIDLRTGVLAQSVVAGDTTKEKYATPYEEEIPIATKARFALKTAGLMLARGKAGIVAAVDVTRIRGDNV